VKFFFDNNLAIKIAHGLDQMVHPEHRVVHLRDECAVFRTAKGHGRPTGSSTTIRPRRPEIIDRIHRIEGMSSGKIGQILSGSLNLSKTSPGAP
jgi:hypothetical protein